MPDNAPLKKRMLRFPDLSRTMPLHRSFHQPQRERRAQPMPPRVTNAARQKAERHG